MTIKDIPIEQRPREKAIRFGIEELSDAELLALLIGSGYKGKSAIDVANELLSSYFNSMYSLSNSNLASLEAHTGLKEAVALRLLAAFEFHHRLNSPKYQKQDSIKTSDEVYLRYQYLENYEQEVLILIMLDSKNRIKQEKLLYKGTFDSFSIDVRQILQEIILAKAKSFILIHNHPDEESTASDNDILATKMIEKSANNLGIKLIDHIIIYRGGFYSIKGDKNGNKN
ncbi:MAG: DNA repair protein RadC [Firmicutes bacterium]|nr:DNA repair protein RadC [Candidatus Fiminaster equi]